LFETKSPKHKEQRSIGVVPTPEESMKDLLKIYEHIISKYDYFSDDGKMSITDHIIRFIDIQNKGLDILEELILNAKQIDQTKLDKVLSVLKNYKK
jgi:hypothetical protein